MNRSSFQGCSFESFYLYLDRYADYLKDSELQNLARDFANVFHDAERLVLEGISEDEYRATVDSFKKNWFGTSHEERLKDYIEERFEKAKKECLDML